MDGTDQAMSSLWYILALVLVGSALVGRRLPLGSFVRMALLWALIFGALLGLFTLAQKSGLFPAKLARDPGEIIPRDGQQTTVTNASQAARPVPAPAVRADGQELRIPVAPDGHYWVDAMVNGVSTRFLIDSGATITAMSENSARNVGLNIDMNAPAVTMTTANGQIDARRASIATLEIGTVRGNDIDVVVSPSFGQINVIGMNMLSRLKSWRVENGEMVLTP